MTSTEPRAGTPIVVSPVGFGSWAAGGGRTWGPNRSDAEVVRAMHAAFDAGANWVDTAEVYGGGGGSERIVGRALSGRPEVLACTKVAPRPDGSGLRRSDIRRALDGSRRRLGRDTIDLYQVHWVDPDVRLEETWTALAEIAEKGAVRWLGLSNVTPEEVARCRRIRPVDTVQLQGSLLHDAEVRAHLDAARRYGSAIICYGVLGFGILAGEPSGDFADWRGGRYGREDFFVNDNYVRHFSPRAYRRRCQFARALAEVAMSFDVTPAQLALRWMLDRGATAVLAGTRSPLHAVENVRAGAIDLTRDLREGIEALRADFLENERQEEPNG